jgi:hypothetical protein
VILLSRAAADSYCTDNLPISLQRDAAGKDHDASAIAGMTGVRVLDGIRRQYSCSVDTAIFEIFMSLS